MRKLLKTLVLTAYVRVYTCQLRIKKYFKWQNNT